MKFREINAVESLSPSAGKTFTDSISIRGIHNQAYCMMKGFSVRREADDMQMKELKFFTKAIKDTQNSTMTTTRFIISTKIVHSGEEDDFWWDNPDGLYISYSVLVVIP
ncbi:MAG: hypothetical protein V4683_08435 [Bacteroidota bacterium]